MSQAGHLHDVEGTKHSQASIQFLHLLYINSCGRPKPVSMALNMLIIISN